MVLGSVCGYVVRADNEMPLQDATVIVAGRSGAPAMAPTDSAGWFTLDGLSPGKWVLRARGPNDEIGEATVPIFNDAFTNVTILVGAPSYDERHRARERSITPSRTGVIEGHIIRALTGEPVENATITVVRGPGPLPDIAPLTDAAGWFALGGLIPGNWVLLARGTDDETGESSVQVSSEWVTNVTIAVAASPHSDHSSRGVSNIPKEPIIEPVLGSVDGHVVHAKTGLPIENATVTVVQGPGPAPDIAPLTDSAGWFALDGLPPGEWVLRARGPDGEAGQVTVTVLGGAVGPITISVGRGRSAALTRSGKARSAKSSRSLRKKRARDKGRGKSSHRS